MGETIRIESARNQELRRILEDQRDRILSAVRSNIREGQAEGAIEDGEVQDEAERSEAEVRSELAFALLQMQGETLERIDEALDRLHDGDYGFCIKCRRAIPAKRLQALPFASRCRSCADSAESKESRHLPNRKRREGFHISM